MTIIAKNVTQEDIILTDVGGMTIPSLSSCNLSSMLYFHEISRSGILKEKVTSGDIVINNEVEDLSIEEGLKSISLSCHLDHTYVGLIPPSNKEILWVKTDEGLVYYYDSIRELWLSISKITYVFSYPNKCANMYLDTFGTITSNLGDYINMSSCIMEINSSFTDSTSSDLDCQFTIRMNKEIIHTYQHDNSLNFNIDTVKILLNPDINSYLQVKCESTNGVYYPLIKLISSKRYVS
jgi:hypothetical protein